MRLMNLVLIMVFGLSLQVFGQDILPSKYEYFVGKIEEKDEDNVVKKVSFILKDKIYFMMTKEKSKLKIGENIKFQIKKDKCGLYVINLNVYNTFQDSRLFNPNRLSSELREQLIKNLTQNKQNVSYYELLYEGKYLKGEVVLVTCSTQSLRNYTGLINIKINGLGEDSIIAIPFYLQVPPPIILKGTPPIVPTYSRNETIYFRIADNNGRVEAIELTNVIPNDVINDPYNFEPLRHKQNWYLLSFLFDHHNCLGISYNHTVLHHFSKISSESDNLSTVTSNSGVTYYKCKMSGDSTTIFYVPAGYFLLYPKLEDPNNLRNNIIFYCNYKVSDIQIQDTNSTLRENVITDLSDRHEHIGH